ncbi:hypothetical protein K2Z83_22615 [Oscillochloris sp. ZM17-4]|uniref:hypothetical protein n=1 Tax=Oscillochloris sp. ZM17-4 TaxID=2866714 RepID=UPI001C736DDF|nr:hypothetical protein [Oscillochloris sp. ZM17-4]MBX0330455.1 hypothetical protein [Oscillochloris sp. ZM17-4]
MLLARAVALLSGLTLVFLTLMSAIRIFVLPRNAADKIAGFVFRVTRRLFNLRNAFSRSYLERDRVMALYAPIGLLTLLLTWLALMVLGYAAMFWASGEGLWDAFRISGSSLLTLGFAFPAGLPGTLLGYSEAAFGMILTALLISYLPTMYGAFSRREAAVTLLEVRAGPLPGSADYDGGAPSAVNMLRRFHALGEIAALTPLWAGWEQWFVELEESHTSLAALAFFRSPSPNRSWVTAAGVVLDAAALRLSTIDLPFDVYASLCLRAGFVALRSIASYFLLPYDPDPHPDDPISISREEFEQAYAELLAAGLPLKADRDQAWRDFAGWRVNYDTVLLGLCRLTMAPPSRWASDQTRRAGRMGS